MEWRRSRRIYGKIDYFILYYKSLLDDSYYKRKIDCRGIYHHPDQGFDDFSESLCKTLHNLNESKTNFVIVGDINLDTKKYNITSNATKYLNKLRSFGCNMFINKPTRITSKSATCIDHVYANLSTNDIENHILSVLHSFKG